MARKARIVETIEGRIIVSEIKPLDGGQSHSLEMHRRDGKGSFEVRFMPLTREELEELKNAVYAMITGID